ncbi:hypothetical protein BATDEDRAFT_90965 [Batrachochytrium dendrobatidis JAM81]|uniref:Uncharacterized protein n=1 Tax=Batrachochytrium dendrobatidis (strain JAM81 / FGSC 10211) TaxID=684364 RepID=F4P8W3_BATDJ|nr:uncharacterized protein BATDEDRAFT_90965 [Batrachochytrium dendrobatidis JAM81]EGF78238.1 hypothetical protein BATDEDRAFT_90965 [Batrachochytrium dendrobatidis JAM81]|eukprot:XP_006681254.1 hypothetical protein BATDEDRAFT_90965 [Batrachochytrium dendrobatidis JAM81]
MKYINFSILATAFALSSSVYAAPSGQQKDIPSGPDTTATISQEENSQNKQAFVSELVELAGTELQSTEKLVIDDERYNPDLKQDYFVIDGDQAYKKGDYWGRDAFVAVLLEYIPKPPSMDEQPETPSTPTQPGLFSGLWSMIWPEEKKPLDPPKSLKQKIDEYHASVKLLSGKYLSWTEKVLQYISQMDVKDTSAPSLKLIKELKMHTQILYNAFETEQEDMQRSANIFKNGPKLELLKSIKYLMANHQKYVQKILGQIKQLLNQYLLTDQHHTIELNPVLDGWFKSYDEMSVKAYTLLK